MAVPAASSIDVNSIVSQLMVVESQPLTTLNTKETAYQAQLAAYNSLSGTMTAFQTAISGLNNTSNFQSLNLNAGDSTIASGTATGQAAPGTYNLNVLALAQAQTIGTTGQASTSATIGSGVPTVLSFQFGTISGGSLGAISSSGSTLSASVASGGIAANSLSINGTMIATGAGTNSAKLLGDAINLKSTTTGVTASVVAATTGSLGSGFGTTTVGGYSLTVGGVSVLSGAAAGVDKAAIDTALAAASSALTAAGVSVTGSAAGGDLVFSRADGANLDLSETLGAGDAGGFFHSAGVATAKTFSGSVVLQASTAITIGGTAPASAGFTAGTTPNGVFSGAAFSQDATQTTGTLVIDGSNNSMQGIRDAINKANLGVTASIVSDGSASPYHLVLTSNKTGATSSMKLTVDGDSALQGLLSYDPANDAGQKMSQSKAAQDASLSLNGIPVTSTTNTVSEAIQGVTLNLSTVGTTTINVAQNTSSITSGVNAFVKAFNDVNTTLKSLTAYDPTTKVAGLLLGDSSVRQIESSLRQMLATPLTGAGGSLTNLQQIGITLQADGSMALDPTKLQAAMTSNFNDIAGLFTTAGKATDSLVSFTGSTSASVPGTLPIYISQLATQGRATGSVSAASGATIIAGVNDTMDISVDGVGASVTLAAGTYSADALTAQIQSAINGDANLLGAGSGVTVSRDSNNNLVITSNRYGSGSNVSMSGSAASALFGGTASVAGLDVAGTIGGMAATGSGQTLTGGVGSPAEGLAMLVSGGALGDRGTVSFSRGYAAQIGAMMTSLTGSNGPLAAETSSINTSIAAIGTQRTTLNDRLNTMEAQYRTTYTNLNVLLSNMNSTMNFMTQQLAALTPIPAA
ncbi:MAG: flagellar hook protein 2 [Massilia sp.]|nr:flagellar hook protein 2 [Massilia sp.]